MKDDKSYHLKEVDNLGIMVEPILSSQGGKEDNPQKKDVSLFDFENMFDVTFEMSNIKMTCSGLSEESLHLLSTPENEKSRKIYEKYQKKYLDYCIENVVKGKEFEESIVNYFTKLYTTGEYSPSCFWTISS